jgi:predicted XRE-type DNA-binding protein
VSTTCLRAKRSEQYGQGQEGSPGGRRWRHGDAADFLELSEEEAAFIDLKLALADFLRKLRTQNSWTQSQVARRLGSSQSRVAKMEAGDVSVSLDLLVKSLLAVGVSRSEMGSVIAKAA